MRGLLVGLACVVAGLAVGGIWTSAQTDRYRADARVLLRSSGEHIGPAAEALAESSLVESNVAQTLHLSEPPDVSATRGEGGVLTVSVEAGSRERARQIDAEAVVILMQKVHQRFGATGAEAVVLDPAHPAEQTSPTPGRNVLVAGLAGLLAGIAAAAATAQARRRSVTSTEPHVEQRLRARIDEVAKRERALARRAGELAVREREAERRHATVEANLDRAEPQVRDLAEVGSARTGAGEWTLEALEDVMRRQAGRDPALRDELAAYVVYLREYADPQGRLPEQFNALIDEIFVARGEPNA